MKTHWRNGDRVRAVEVTPLGEGRWRIVVDDAAFEIEAAAAGDGTLRIVADGATHTARVTAAGDRRFVRFDRMDFVLSHETRGRAGRGAADGGLEAPMPGTVTKVHVEAGAAVTKGQPLVAIEAMKMEHVIRAPRDGTVTAVLVKQGEMVDAGAALVEIDTEGPEA